jgi:hypothetical protein
MDCDKQIRLDPCGAGVACFAAWLVMGTNTIHLILLICLAYESVAAS